jgi:uncharacterized protein
MIIKEELRQLGANLGFTVYQAEKDFMQHLFLKQLYSVSGREFVFKGGTAIQKIFGLNRFSEDLDFTLNGSHVQYKMYIEKAIKKMKAIYETELTTESIIKKSYHCKIRIKGPLFTGHQLSYSYLKLELSQRDDLVQEPEIKKIVPIYPTLPPYTVYYMPINEILSEKVRAIMTRNKARDVYDLWFLLKKHNNIDTKLVDYKLQSYQKSFSNDDFFYSIRSKEKVWASELKILLKYIPDFHEIINEIFEMIGTID